MPFLQDYNDYYCNIINICIKGIYNTINLSYHNKYYYNNLINYKALGINML